MFLTVTLMYVPTTICNSAQYSSSVGPPILTLLCCVMVLLHYLIICIVHYYIIYVIHLFGQPTVINLL